ncbi:hypothetical protein PVAP13_3NG276482 [Panicum virgatum]|uniref:Uncharacterized protein n=1 Tax=Panicum virgatum TaxID=38727 RepID=A0A8T0UDX6_PANVG|nr:hypothetical protein PVAP13_3NG276482 [Panicum virgatum]
MVNPDSPHATFPCAPARQTPSPRPPAPRRLPLPRRPPPACPTPRPWSSAPPPRQLAAPAPAPRRRSSVRAGGRPSLPRWARARAGRRVAATTVGGGRRVHGSSGKRSSSGRPHLSLPPAALGVDLRRRRGSVAAALGEAWHGRSATTRRRRPPLSARARAAGKIRLRAGELRRLHGRASASSAVPVARARSMVVPSALPPRLRRLRRRHGRDPALRWWRGPRPWGFCLAALAVLAADTGKGWARNSYSNYTQFRCSEVLNVISFVYSV